MTAVTLVVAMARNGVIGRDNALPWRLPEDLKHFKAVTIGKPVLMGRKTFESIGGVLDGRDVIVVTRSGEAPAAGVFVAPTVFDGVRPTMRVFREEIFGPVLSVVRFGDEAEAIALANDTMYGLANSVWTKNIDTALRVTKALRSGLVWVNTTLDNGPQMPFGGVKASGGRLITIFASVRHCAKIESRP